MIFFPSYYKKPRPPTRHAPCRLKKYLFSFEKKSVASAWMKKRLQQWFAGCFLMQREFFYRHHPNETFWATKKKLFENQSQSASLPKANIAQTLSNSVPKKCVFRREKKIVFEIKKKENACVVFGFKSAVENLVLWKTNENCFQMQRKRKKKQQQLFHDCPFTLHTPTRAKKVITSPYIF